MFEIVYGNRRYRAAIAAGFKSIPAFVRELTDEEAMEIQIVENLQRQDVHPLDEARGFRHLIEVKKQTVAEIAAKFGKSTAYVRGRMQLTMLCTQGVKDMNEGSLPLTVALELCKLEPGLQAEVLKNLREDCPAQMISDIREHAHQPLSEAVFDTTDTKLEPKAGACTHCVFRTGNQPDLYQDVKKDICTKPGCFKSKTRNHYQNQVNDYKAQGVTVLTGEKAELATRGGNVIDLNQQCYESKGEKTYKTLLGKAEIEELKDKRTVVLVQGGYSSNSPLVVKELYPKASVMAALRRKGYKWAEPETKSKTATGEKKPKRDPIKDEANKAIRLEILRRSGEELAKGLGDIKKPSVFLKFFFLDLLDRLDTYIDNEEQIVEAFGEASERAAKGSKYVWPWHKNRVEAMPVKDLVRLIGILQADSGNSRDIEAGMLSSRPWLEALGIDYKKAYAARKSELEAKQ